MKVRLEILTLKMNSFLCDVLLVHAHMMVSQAQAETHTCWSPTRIGPRVTKDNIKTTKSYGKPSSKKLRSPMWSWTFVHKPSLATWSPFATLSCEGLGVHYVLAWHKQVHYYWWSYVSSWYRSALKVAESVPMQISNCVVSRALMLQNMVMTCRENMVPSPKNCSDVSCGQACHSQRSVNLHWE
jgi:hypothetical protein